MAADRVLPDEYLRRSKEKMIAQQRFTITLMPTEVNFLVLPKVRVGHQIATSRTENPRLTNLRTFTAHREDKYEEI